MARSREEVETILTTEVRIALERFQAANSALLDETAAATAGVYRLEQAREAKATAAAELRRALRRHSRFILNREIPPDLNPVINAALNPAFKEEQITRAACAQTAIAE
jgi:hypothetical protein